MARLSSARDFKDVSSPKGQRSTSDGVGAIEWTEGIDGVAIPGGTIFGADALRKFGGDNDKSDDAFGAPCLTVKMLSGDAGAFPLPGDVGLGAGETGFAGFLRDLVESGASESERAAVQSYDEECTHSNWRKGPGDRPFRLAALLDAVALDKIVLP